MAWTRIKHFTTFLCTPKHLQVQFHLVDCMVFNGKMYPRVYFTTKNIHNDENLTITIIHHVLTHWSGNILQVLYLQLDNTSREKKNCVWISKHACSTGNLSKGENCFPSCWTHS
jgi:hypothetical protein